MQLNDSKKKNSLWVIRKILVRMFPWGGGPHAPSKRKTVQFAKFSDLTWKGIFSYFSKIAFTSIGYIFAQMKLLDVDQQTPFAFRKLHFIMIVYFLGQFYFQYTENWFIKRKVQVKLSFVWIMNLTGLADLITLKWKYWNRQGHPTRI